MNNACTISKQALERFSRTKRFGLHAKKASSKRILARLASATSTVLGDESDGTVGTKHGRRTFAKQLEYLFESTLFSCRFMVIAAVIGSVLMSLMLFTCGILEVWHTFKSVITSILREGRLSHTADLSLSSVEAMDMFLTGIVTFIFGTGVYELFVSDIDVAGEYKSANGKDEKPGWMSVSGIDDLEVRLGKVVITVLIVQIMAVAKSLHVTTPLHMVYMGIAFFLAAAGLSLLTWVEKSHK